MERGCYRRTSHGLTRGAAARWGRFMVDNLAILISHVLMMIALWRVMQLPDDGAPTKTPETPVNPFHRRSHAAQPAKKRTDPHA